MSMARIKQLAPVLAVSLVLIVLATSGIVWLVIHNAQQQKTVQIQQVHDQLMNYADGLKTSQSYSTLPHAEAQAFLDQQAAAYAFDPRLQKATPDALRASCIERAQHDLLGLETSLHNKLSAADFKDFVPTFEHARMTMRANCYANFDPTGKEDIAAIMAH